MTVTVWVFHSGTEKKPLITKPYVKAALIYVPGTKHLKFHLVQHDIIWPGGRLCAHGRRSWGGQGDMSPYFTK